jgi:protein-S-isoprenylcysteine O-methyltransferase Ste14
MSSKRLRDQGFVNRYRKPLFILMMLGLAAYLYFVKDPWKLPSMGVMSLQLAGAILMFAGILGRILATITIGGHKDKTVVRTEIYSICRNPLYFASFLMALGVGALSGRLDFTLVIALAYLAVFYPMMINEARYLREKFEDFSDYEKQVPLFFPNPTLWQERHHFEINYRLVRRTLLDACIALPVIPLMFILRAVWCG